MSDTLRVPLSNLCWNAWKRLAAALLFVVGLLVPDVARASGLDIERPGQREFVVDHADILDASAEREIKRVAADLLDEHVTSIVVVTIESMADHGGERMDIETFARILFDQWGVGHPEVHGQRWNTGILVVISRDDRKARIELGEGWAHDKDDEAQHIMQTRMVPAFREGDYSRGATEAVIALDAMARSKPLPEPAKPLRFYLWMAVAIVLVLAILVSIIKTGRQGWGWKTVVLVFGLVSALLGLLWWLSQFGGSSSSSGRIRPRGSFGGGRSGGGGATGSW